MQRIETTGKRWRGRGTKASRSRRLRPTVMAMEGRTLLSTFMVDSTADDGSAGTLRWAIGQANANDQADTIDFSSLFAAPQTITLTAGQLVLTDTATTSILGPGASLLSISGGGLSRVFDLDGGSATLSGLTVTGGQADHASGLYNKGGTLTLTACIVTGNSAFQNGAGLYNQGGTTTLINCTVSDNRTAGEGGGLYSAGGTLALTNCDVSGNASTEKYGGGLFNNAGTTTLTNCTVSGNSAGLGGGGLANYSNGTLALTNCTVSANVTYVGYGVGGVDILGGAVSLTNTIVSGNGSHDVGGSYTGSNNLISIDPLLAALGDYGGPTATMALLPGSPAIGGGVTGTGVPMTDQRGFGRSGRIDIGAFQSQGFRATLVPGGTGQSTIVGQPFAEPLAIAVTANNPIEPVDGGVVTYAVNPAPGGATSTLSTSSAVVADGQSGVIATANGVIGAYSVTASVGAFGSFTFFLTNSPIPSLVVNTTGDDLNWLDGKTTLREALVYAQSLSGPSTINFSPAVFGTTPQTITLSLGQLVFGSPTTTTVSGPGAGLLTINGNNATRLIAAYGGSSAALSGLTITGGSADRGGGVLNLLGTVSLTNAVITGNTSTNGGGLYNYGRMFLTDCTVSGNTATNGGGIYCVAGGASIQLTDCTISGNAAGDSGGGLFNNGGSTMSLNNVAIYGNTATRSGGGGLTSNDSRTSMTNCTISGNSAGHGGGLTERYYGHLTLTNCTVSGDSASNGGGLYIIRLYGQYPFSDTASLTNTIVAGQKSGGDIAGDYILDGSHNLIGGDPLLAPLGDYGGPRPTMPLLPGSPALGAGASGPGIPTTDQRGQPRTGHVDIGAFQSQGSTVVVNDTTDGAGSGAGQISLRQAVNLADVLDSADTIDFDPTVFATAQTITLTDGPLTLTDKVTTTITGPGANLLAISGNKASRVFAVYDGSALLSGLTVTGGSSVSGSGLYNKDGTLSLTGCTVSGNNAGLDGGGLVNAGGTATLTDCTVSGNTATGSGGGLFNLYGIATLIDCTVSGNDAGLDGGGLVNDSGTATLTDCTVSGNVAGLDGGGLNNYSGGLALTNTIVAGQKSGGDVAGRYIGGNNLIGGDPLLAALADNGGPTLTYALLPGSLAIGRAGAVATLAAGGVADTTSIAVTLASSSLLAIANLPALASGDYFIIQVDSEQMAVTALTLNDDGTTTLTVVRGADGTTAAIHAGGAPVLLASDQRGELIAPGGPDIGAFQSQGFTVTPVAGSTPQSIMTGQPFANPLAVTVTAVNPAEPVDGGVVTFAAPATGASAALSAASVVIANGQAGVTATAGTIGGSYAVTTSVENAKAAASFALTNTESLSLVVDTVLDTTDGTDGRTSLREALAYAASLVGPQTITFDPSVFGTTPQTITLTLGVLTLTDTATITISGPGANLLTVSGNDASQVFQVEDGSAAIAGLTVTGGQADRGGGVLNQGGTLALTAVTIRGNTAFDQGGGLATQFSGTTTLTDCTVSGNSAGLAGGGLANLYNGAATLIDCTVSDNTTAYNGGGLADLNGALALVACTVSGNSAGQQGGGLYSNSGPPTLTDTIVSVNAGGDIRGAVAPASANNLVGDGSGLTGISGGSQGNQVGTAQAPLDPLLAPLGDYGGPTPTMALLPGSAAIGAGAAGPGIPATDQRNQPRAGHVDIGAFQSQGFTLTPGDGSTPQSAAVGRAFANALAVTVTANNPVEPVNGGAIRFAAIPAAGAASATLSAATVTIQSGQAAVTATANSTSGGYSVTATAAGASSASFSLTNARTLASPRPISISPLSPIPGPTVTADVLLNVDGLTSLRAAIAYANSHPGPDTITVDPAVFGKSRRTITLIGGPLVLTDPATTTILGPGAKRLTIRGAGKGRVFDVEAGSLSLSGVTIVNGKADLGGGLRNDRGSVVLTNVVIRGNRAIAGGGLFNDGRTTLSAVSIKGNRAYVGSGIFNTRAATLRWRRSPAAIGKTARLHHTERERTA